MTKDTAAAIEQNIREAKKALEFATSIERLQSNRDFKKVFQEGYFEQEAIRLVHLKADPSMQSEKSQKAILSQMDSVGSLAQFLTLGLQMGELAKKQIASDEQTLEEMLAEEVNQ